MKVRAEGRISQATRKWRMKRRSGRSCSTSNQELVKQHAENSVLRRWVWRRGPRHHPVRPLCRVVCQGEKQNFFQLYPVYALTATFAAVLKENILLRCHAIVFPHIYSYMVPSSLPQCHHLWHLFTADPPHFARNRPLQESDPVFANVLCIFSGLSRPMTMIITHHLISATMLKPDGLVRCHGVEEF